MKHKAYAVTLKEFNPDASNHYNEVLMYDSNVLMIFRDLHKAEVFAREHEEKLKKKYGDKCMFSCNIEDAEIMY